MILEYEGFVLSNENLQVGDEVFPIYWPAFEEFEFADYCSGWPNEPHKILELKRSDYKPYETSTSHGYGPQEIYFKIVDMVDKVDRTVKPNIVLIPKEPKIKGDLTFTWKPI